jgi:hypothetical protein
VGTSKHRGGFCGYIAVVQRVFAPSSLEELDRVDKEVDISELVRVVRHVLLARTGMGLLCAFGVTRPYPPCIVTAKGNVYDLFDVRKRLASMEKLDPRSSFA